MRRVLLLLLGLLLIGVLAYFCFMSKALGIKEDLISKTQTVYTAKGLKDINIGIRGDNLEQTRILTLTGEVLTAKARKEAGILAQNIEGVDGVDNKLVIASVAPVIKKDSIKKEIIKKEIIHDNIEMPKAEIVEKPKVVKVTVPSPYTINVIKKKDGKVTLSGYVADRSVHEKLVADAKGIFGDTNVFDELKEIEGSPEAWYDSSKLGLDKLAVVEYGHFEISDNNFNFEGYVLEISKKDSLYESLKSNLNNLYSGTFIITAPEPKVVEVAVVTCQAKFKELLSQHKIHFEYNKADIKTDSYELLEQLIIVAQGCPDAKITIEGHTDSDGSQDYNKKLSSKRADAVKQYLIQKGMDATKLEAIGYGEMRPIADNETNAGKEQNRRIEFNIKGVE